MNWRSTRRKRTRNPKTENHGMIINHSGNYCLALNSLSWDFRFVICYLLFV